MAADTPPEVQERPLQPGDIVQIRRELDETLAVRGERTPPATIEAVYDGEKQPSIVVRFDDSAIAAYLASDVLLVEPPDRRTEATPS